MHSYPFWGYDLQGPERLAVLLLRVCYWRGRVSVPVQSYCHNVATAQPHWEQVSTAVMWLTQCVSPCCAVSRGDRPRSNPPTLPLRARWSAVSPRIARTAVISYITATHGSETQRLAAVMPTAGMLTGASVRPTVALATRKLPTRQILYNDQQMREISNTHKLYLRTPMCPSKQGAIF
jgi:hypothetical protein